MPRLPLLALALALASAAAVSAAPAQEPGPATGRCALPDSIAVHGNHRISDLTIRSTAGLIPGDTISYRTVQRAIHDLFAMGEFADVQINCEPAAAGRTIVGITVRERPVVGSFDVTGTERLSAKTLHEKIALVPGRPADPALVARGVASIDSAYEKAGFYLAKVTVDSALTNDTLRLTFRVNEGSRLAVSGVVIHGNRALSEGQIVGAMKTRPEGFLWTRKGEFDEDTFAGDLGERIPALYARQGFIDFQILRDTVIIDRERGKALVDLTVSEGPRYFVGRFDVTGNRRFSTEEIDRFYPFQGQGPSLTKRVTQLLPFGEKAPPKGVFDASAWEDAHTKLQSAYSNEGYIYASIRPVVDRQVVVQNGDTNHVVNLRWEIQEGNPAIINRVDIAGNDYTSEACIRDQLIILPGDVFNQERLIRSYQNIANMGFFETPLPPPDTKPANDQGDVDVIFHVKEKKTGNINFGASVGQGTGLGGFIGLDQPNLFGLCKRGSLQWQFGSRFNDFNLSYTDPALLQSRTSATVSAYHTRTRYIFSDLGQITRAGGSVQLGFPVPQSPFSRLFVSYGGELAKYGNSGYLGTVNQEFGGKSFWRSTLGFTAQHDTRIDMPFPTAGGMQNLSASFSGGPLGGEASFQRYTTELFSYAPLGQIGGGAPGSQAIKFVLGLRARAGAVFGDPGPFFFTQSFAVGGTQFGESLRGYEEFSITPTGFNPNARTETAYQSSFGRAFFTTSAEVGVRFSQMLYVDAFFDAGNNYLRPQDFDPTRLFRGAGIGFSLVTPLGPLGLDLGYGFDKIDPTTGVNKPSWTTHFKFGQFF